MTAAACAGCLLAFALLAPAQTFAQADTPAGAAERASRNNPPPQAERAPAATAPGTGDPWLDAFLIDIGLYGRQYRAAFVDELVRYQGAPRASATQWLDARWSPGNLYLACAVAQHRGRPCRYVVERFDPTQGWAPILASMDMPAGSPDLHRVKRGLVETYRRWARPVTLDAALQADFPQRAKNPANRFVAPAPAGNDDDDSPR